MYTRRDCPLCDTAWEKLQQAQRRWGFRLEMLDVDTNPEWVRQFGDSVPVVTVNDKVRFRGEVNSVLLERLLRAESTR